MTDGGQEEQQPATRLTDGCVGRQLSGGQRNLSPKNNHHPHEQPKLNYHTNEIITIGDEKLICNNEHDNGNDDYDDHGEEELLSEALLAVVSAEEYAAKIIKLQQACLTPLKEDLAEWLNKIMNMSSITTDNFMDKLDNGVIICRLAKIISLWCEQQLAKTSDHDDPTTTLHNNHQATLVTNLKLDAFHTNNHHLIQSHTNSSKLSSSILNVHLPISNNDMTFDVDEPYRNCSRKNSTPILATPFRHPQSRLTMFTNGSNVPSRSSSQSTNCLISSSTTSLNNGYTTNSGNRFLNNLIRMEQTKIWEDAKCRTFYARDNVCNFIRWSKEFGVNQSVLFESDDLVLHANTRQVVLCLLDVARIACVQHGFTEPPGLVKFEQEIGRELAAEKAAAIERLTRNSTDGYDGDEHQSSYGDKQRQTNEIAANRKLTSLARNSRVGSLADATDDLIMRYCLHKEEEAAKKKAAAAKLEAKLRAEEEEARLAAEAAVLADLSAKSYAVAAAEEAMAVATVVAPEIMGHDEVHQPIDISEAAVDVSHRATAEEPPFEVDSQTTYGCYEDKQQTEDPLPLSSESMIQKNNLNYDNRVDSLDSGVGRTESASTSHSRTPVNGVSKTPLKASSIPKPIKRSNSNSSLISHQTSSIGTSQLSSSRSSLFSGQHSSSAKRHMASDLDGKVMRIAKSYYGKAATKGVTRLSEGKYKIADRIVFVRLLKGHLVMVRIGGGWDTLENFLFRHKSDPSQVIDVDNLLPLETKLTFEKTPQSTPTSSNKLSRLPPLLLQ